MEYEIYKRKLSKRDYFSNWVPEQLENLIPPVLDSIYEKYIVKQQIMVRDKFTCQHMNCTYCKNIKEHPKLTLHHIKAKRNGGEDKARNGVTLCDGIHRAYEKAKKSLVFCKTANHLPNHIKGHTFKLNKPEPQVNWKKVRVEGKKFRKTLKDKCGLKLSWEDVYLLMLFLERVHSV